jgi:4,5-dihydroxyphthalate decarboxylase
MENRNLNRRELMRAGALAGALGATGCQTAAAATIGKPQIKIAGYDYDRVRAIMDGRVGIPGSDVVFEQQDIYTVNQSAFGPERKYEVTELGLIPYVTKYINEGFRAYTLIPVFPSRIFRHRSIYVHVDAGIEKPGDLRGRRIGAPGYGSSANTWIRGFLLDEYGVKADEMRWIEATKSSDKGSLRSDDLASRYRLPPGFPLEAGPPDMDESELLLSRDCDAVIAPITPRAFLERDPRVKRLFSDVRAAEQAYYQKSGLFPIMHVVAIRNDAIKADPGLPQAVFEMYSRAKHFAYANLETTTSLKTVLPWAAQDLEDTRALMGDDFWPYGLQPNRKELELIMRYTYEQGLVKERGEFEGMFHPSTLKLTESA